MKRIYILSLLTTLAVLYGCVSGYCLSLSDIRTQVRRNIRDSDSANYRYSDTVLNDIINEGQKMIVNMTWLNQDTTQYSLTPNTSYYNLPSDYLAAYKVYFKNIGGVTTNLTEMSQKSLYDTNPDWERFTNTPVQYWVSPATSPVVGVASYLRMAYIPIGAVNSTGTVTIWYYSESQDLANDSDVPFNGQRQLYTFHPSLVYYTTMRLFMIDGIMDEAKAYSDIFQSYIAIIKDRIGRMPNYTPSFSTK